MTQRFEEHVEGPQAEAEPAPVSPEDVTLSAQKAANPSIEKAAQQSVSTEDDPAQAALGHS